MWHSKREISRECNDIIGWAKGSQISEKYWGEVGKGKRVDVYLEVRKRTGQIFFEWNKCLCYTRNIMQLSQWNYRFCLTPKSRYFIDIYIIRKYIIRVCIVLKTQVLVSFKTYMPPPLPYFKVNICPLPLPHFSSIFFAYLWSFRWPNYIVTLPRYFSFRLPHLDINTGPPSDELDKNIQRKSHLLFFSHGNGYSHFRPF